MGLGNDNTSDTTKNSATVTLTNKRITTGGRSEPAYDPYAVNSDNFDMSVLRGIAALTINAPTEPDAGTKLMMRFIDNERRALTFQTGSSGQFCFSSDLTAPPTTIISKTLCGFIYNSTDSLWIVSPP